MTGEGAVKVERHLRALSVVHVVEHGRLQDRREEGYGQMEF